MQYSITNLNAFFIVLAFGYTSFRATDVSFISQLRGLGRGDGGQFYANPVLGLSLAICLFSMAGIPPLVGFFAKYMVLYSAIENGYYFLAFIGILASVVSAAYYLRIIRVIHFDVPEYPSDLRSEQGTPTQDGTLVAQSSGPHQGCASGGRYHAELASTHSYVISVLTLFIALFILSPSL